MGQAFMRMVGIGLAFLLANSWVEAEVNYLYPDHLGSTSLVSNSEGEVVESFQYTPFGEISGTLHSTLDSSHYQFTGQERDATSELSYFNARYYDATLSRFLSVDPIFSGGNLHDPQQRNPYSYARNNPMLYLDSTGNYVESVWDVASLDLSLAQCAENCDSWWDRAGLAYDTVAVAAPILPGGYGVARRFSKSPLVRRAVDFAFFGFGRLDNLRDLASLRPRVIEVGANGTRNPFRIADTIRDVVVSVDPAAAPNPGFYRYFRGVMGRVFHYFGTAEELANQGVRAPIVVLNQPGPAPLTLLDHYALLDPLEHIRQGAIESARQAQALVDPSGVVLVAYKQGEPTFAFEAFNDTSQWRALAEEETRTLLQSIGNGLADVVAGYQRIQ
ncbi:MAG: hypothetical protein HY538_01620 [Deltaproteobacteria bacterium]|nr:hypothetical protein [Deltaproteobacteria bacterium]